MSTFYGGYTLGFDYWYYLAIGNRVIAFHASPERDKLKEMFDKLKKKMEGKGVVPVSVDYLKSALIGV